MSELRSTFCLKGGAVDSANGEVMREKVEELAQAWAHDPTTVVEVEHAEFNGDLR